MAAVELVSLITDRAAWRHEPERAVLAGLPREVRGAPNHVLEKLARGDERVDEIVLDGRVAPEHENPFAVLAEEEEDQIEGLRSVRRQDLDLLARRRAGIGDLGDRLGQRRRRAAFERRGEGCSLLVRGRQFAARVDHQSRSGKPRDNRFRAARQHAR